MTTRQQKQERDLRARLRDESVKKARHDKEATHRAFAESPEAEDRGEEN